MPEVRVLSVRQPYADWIIHSTDETRKWIEVRTWSSNYRGRVYIHASRWDSGYADLKRESPPDHFQLGHIIGSVELVDIVSFDVIYDAFNDLEAGREPPLTLPVTDTSHRGWEDAVDGCMCWLLDDPQPLEEPIETAGKLNLWKFDLPE